MPARLGTSCPCFLVADVRRAVEHYRDRLGFRIVGTFFEEPPVYGIVDRDRAEVHVALASGGRGGSNRAWRDEAIDAYVRVDDVDALHAELTARGADLLGPPVLRIYGMKEIEARDADGYVICFGQDMGPAAGA